jgi:hypothetical protein
MNRKILSLAFAFTISTTHAASFVGTYHCKGHDPYINSNYTGTLVVKQQNAVYNITMQYNTGEKYKATGGQYNNELMSVVFQDTHDLHRVGLEQYRFLDDEKKIGGYWVYLGKDKLGKEICVKQEKT